MTDRWLIPPPVAPSGGPRSLSITGPDAHLTFKPLPCFQGLWMKTECAREICLVI